MSRWGSNGGLLLISFLMAVGIVWIKAQERLDRRSYSGIPVSVENLPNNIMMPDPWTPPAVSVTLGGPRSVLDMIRAVQCGFFIHLSPQILPENETPLDVILTASMFRTSMMDDDDLGRITVDETSIRPRKVSLFLLPWDVEKDRPDYKSLSSPDSLIIPIYRIQKKVPVNAPTVGSMPSGLKLKDVVVDPPAILITGPKEAVDRIHSVSTAIMDLSYLTSQPLPQYMALPDLEDQYSVWPVEKTIQGVTVTFMVTK